MPWLDLSERSCQANFLVSAVQIPEANRFGAIFDTVTNAIFQIGERVVHVQSRRTPVNRSQFAAVGVKRDRVADPAKSWPTDSAVPVVASHNCTTGCDQRSRG